MIELLPGRVQAGSNANANRRNYQNEHPMNTNSKKLAGKVAVVTGASKGIGASIAKHLAAEGAAVVVNYSSSKSGADAVVAEITAQGGKAAAWHANVAKKTQVESVVAQTT